MGLRSRIGLALGKAKNKLKEAARYAVSGGRAKAMQIYSKAAGVDEFVWTTRGDDRVRKAHKLLEGKRYRWDRGGHPTEGIPGLDPFACRCRPVPVRGKRP